MASEPSKKKPRTKKQQAEAPPRRPAAAAPRAAAHAAAVSAPVATPARKSPKSGVATAKDVKADGTATPAVTVVAEAAPAAAATAQPAATASASSAGTRTSTPGQTEVAPVRVEAAPASTRLEGGPSIDTKSGLAFLRLSSECSPTMSVERLVYLDKDEVTFGRMPSNTVILDSSRFPQMISRVHGRLCRLREEGKPVEWILNDNKSMNGILVNGQPIGQEGRRLRQGDSIMFGRKMCPPEFEFVFEEPGSQMETPAAAPAPDPSPAVEEAFAEHARRIAELQQELEAEREHKIMESQQRAVTRSEDICEDIQSELLCSICQDWVVHASTIECSHTFCWACIDQWLLQKKFECPVCRHVVTREPVRSRAIETIVQKTVDRGSEEGKMEYRERVSSAEKDVKRVKKMAQDLEKSVDEALKKGKAFFHIDAVWTRREKEVFQRGIKDYTGETRETYCKLTSLTVQWVHSADDSKLNQALHNLGLQAFVSSTEPDIRKRLLMFLRYG